MRIERVNVIGSGNVGKQLAQQIAVHRNVVSIYSRGFEKARSLSKLIDATPVSRAEGLKEDVDLNIVCVSDDSIKEVIQKLPKHIPIVHTSGSVDISIFEGFEHFGILYPLQTFSADRAVEMDHVPFLIEANSEEFQQALVYFAQDCFSELVELCDSEKRKLIHIAAVITANFSNQLVKQAKDILDKESISYKILEPLMYEIVKKAFDLGPEEAQTGPAQRGDKEIIQNHLNMLEGKEIKEVYRILSKLINPEVVD